MFTLALLLAAAPVVPLPAEIAAPLGHFGNTVDGVPTGGASPTDKVLVPAWEGCAPQGVYLMRFLLGEARTLEQLQQSLDRTRGVEKKLFSGKKDVLGSVLRQLSASKVEAKVPCQPSPRQDGWMLALDRAPVKWCEAPADASEGEFWFFAQGRPAAVILVERGAAQTLCKPRVSSVLFDPRGQARLRLHADWGGAIATTLVGEKCQSLDYTLDVAKQTFVPTWKSCKR